MTYEYYDGDVTYDTEKGHVLYRDPKKKKRVSPGRIVGDTLVRKVTNRDFFGIGKGYCFNVEVLAFLREKGISNITIIAPKGTLYGTREQWEASPLYDKGHGKQRCLPVAEMMKEAV